MVNDSACERHKEKEQICHKAEGERSDLRTAGEKLSGNVDAKGKQPHGKAAQKETVNSETLEGVCARLGEVWKCPSTELFKAD